MSVYRIDHGSLRPPQQMPDGRLRVEGYLTRAGVFTYLNPDGTERKEYRPPEEVFSDKALRSFALMSVTNDHPPELINSKNAKKYTVGVLGEGIRRDGDHVAGPLIVFDEDTIADMRRGKKELSCGYHCDVVQKPGVSPDGERYDAIQTNIRGNHVAIVDVARAGSTARVRMDAAVMKKEPSMAKKEENKLTLEAAAATVAQADARASAAERERDALQTRLDKAEGEVESLRQRLDSMKDVRKDAGEVPKLQATINGLTSRIDSLEREKRRIDAEYPDKLRKAVKNRIRIEAAASVILKGQQNFDSIDDRTLMASVIERLQGVSVDANRTDDYVQARFDAAVEGYLEGNRGLELLKDVVAPTVTEPRQDAQAARAKMIDRNRNLWKGQKEA